MIVKKTSIFPAPKETVFQKLQQLETLQYIAWPYATFKPIGKAVPIWTVGSTSAYRFRLFGLIPFGTHTIHIVRFDPDGVSSREGNEHVPVPWLCRTDHELAEVLHARLIRTQTEIHGGEFCDYWYVGDRSPALVAYSRFPKI